MPRIAPLSPAYTPEQEARLGALMREGATVPPLAIFHTFARHPTLQDAIKSLGHFHLVPDAEKGASLAPRDREIVITASARAATASMNGACMSPLSRGRRA